MGGLYNVWDYREAAKRRMPRAFFEFLDRGTEDEHAMRANRAALEAVKLRQRILQDVRQIDTSTELFGRKLPLPLATAPTGVADIIAYRGELAVARAAGKAGIPYTLATSSTTPMEAVVEAATAGCWLQMYVWDDRDASFEIAARAERAGMEALVITVAMNVVLSKDFLHSLDARLDRGFVIGGAVLTKQVLEHVSRDDRVAFDGLHEVLADYKSREKLVNLLVQRSHRALLRNRNRL